MDRRAAPSAQPGLSSYLDQPWGRGASIQGSEWGADGLQKGGGGL